MSSMAQEEAAAAGEASPTCRTAATSLPTVPSTHGPTTYMSANATNARPAKRTYRPAHKAYGRLTKGKEQEAHPISSSALRSKSSPLSCCNLAVFQRYESSAWRACCLLCEPSRAARDADCTEVSGSIHLSLGLLGSPPLLLRFPPFRTNRGSRTCFFPPDQ